MDLWTYTHSWHMQNKRVNFKQSYKALEDDVLCCLSNLSLASKALKKPTMADIHLRLPLPVSLGGLHPPDQPWLPAVPRPDRP
eukprot:1156124-Pelagomonas_calceolata.AAC.2